MVEGSGNGNVATEVRERGARPEGGGIPTAPGESDLGRSRRARALRRTFLALLAVFLLLGATGTLGVRTGHTTATGGGYELTVTYGKVSRPGLPTPWSFEVRRPGGFDGPVTVTSTSKYLDLFDENGFDPQPSKATSTQDLVIWEFDPPPGDTLTVSFDARIEPSAQWGRSGETAVLEDGKPVVIARYRTWILP
jgi:hypothetical protein